MGDIFDLIIIGGGPAGYTAALYGARAGLGVGLIEKLGPGGQMGTTDMVDNYPGFPQGVNGFELAMKMKEGAERFGVKTISGEVTEVKLSGDIKTISTPKEAYQARTVILATGAHPRELGLQNERELRGRGVSYCATCDGMFYRDKVTYVVGGGNTACEEADFLSRICSKVVMVVRKDHLRAQASLVERVELNPKVEVRYRCAIAKLEGDGLPESITLRDTETGELERVEHGAGTFGVFVFIGTVPASGLVEGLAELNGNGEVVTGADMSTSTPGLFVAGDVRQTPLRQVVTAAADGAVAANSAALFLGNLVI